jgi:hypothetical protein
LKRETNKSNFLSLRRAWIFTQSMGLHITNLWANDFFKTKSAFNKTKCFQTFLQHENSTNIEKIMLVAFIDSWLGNHHSNSKIKELITCEH